MQKWLELLPHTHCVGCPSLSHAQCTCTPVARIRLLEMVRSTAGGDHVAIARCNAEIETLRKVAVIYAQAPHMLLG